MLTSACKICLCWIPPWILGAHFSTYFPLLLWWTCLNMLFFWRHTPGLLYGKGSMIHIFKRKLPNPNKLVWGLFQAAVNAARSFKKSAASQTLQSSHLWRHPTDNELTNSPAVQASFFWICKQLLFHRTIKQMDLLASALLRILTSIYSESALQVEPWELQQRLRHASLKYLWLWRWEKWHSWHLWK